MPAAFGIGKDLTMTTKQLLLFVGAMTLVACADDTKTDRGEDDIRAGGAQVVLQYTPARKAEVISGLYFEAGDFTGNAVIAKDGRTEIDIMYLMPDNDAAPDTLCYKGAVSGVKKILSAMLVNTDGNGDHYLDDGYKIEKVGSTPELRVTFSVTGEGGSMEHELSVPRCP
jgi:hypothetical protein